MHNNRYALPTHTHTPTKRPFGVASPDVVAFDLDLLTNTVSNRRKLTNDGLSQFPVCWDDQGPNIEFFFQSRVNPVLEVHKGEADGSIVTVVSDPLTAYYGPFPIRR